MLTLIKETVSLSDNSKVIDYYLFDDETEREIKFCDATGVDHAEEIENKYIEMHRVAFDENPEIIEREKVA